MKHITLLGALMFGVLAISGCSDDNAEQNNSKQTTVEKHADVLDEHDDITFEKGTLTIMSDGGKHVFDIELAETDSQHTYGFMFRKDIPQNTGMLFVFDKPREAAFWMKNTYVPLDMLFIDSNDTVITIQEKATPLSTERVPSQGIVKYVLELPGGEVERLGLEVGDIIEWSRENDEANEKESDEISMDETINIKPTPISADGDV